MEDHSIILFISKMMEDDVRCSLCFNVFFHPVTTSCGHTYCKECLERSFVYSSQCPLCRAPIYPNPTLMSITEQIDVMVKNSKLFHLIYLSLYISCIYLFYFRFSW